MGNEHEAATKAPTPAPTPSPATAVRKRTFKKRPHVLEKTTAVKLLLRRIADRAHYPSGTTGSIKAGRLAVAATISLRSSRKSCSLQ
jgi:hypothetical protein